MTKLADVATIVDCEHKTAPISEHGSYFAVGTPAMRGNVIDFSEARTIDCDTFDAWTRRLRPSAGDILFAREAPVGPAVRIPEAENVAPGQRTVLIRADSARIGSRYLYYKIVSPQFQAAVDAVSAGSTVPHLNVADVRSVDMGELPTMAKQVSIGEVLGALDDKIAANHRVQTLGKELIQARWDALSSGAVQTKCFEEVVDINPRTPLSEQAEHFYLDMKDLPQGGILAERWITKATRSGSKFKNGDTLLGRITPCFENGKAGFVDFLESNHAGVGSTEYLVFRPKEGVPRAIPFAVATSVAFRSHAARGMTGTSGRQRVQASGVADFQLGWPSASAVREFDELTSSLLARMGSARDENAVLDCTRDELLPLLMSGKITIKDAERAAQDVL